MHACIRACMRDREVSLRALWQSAETCTTVINQIRRWEHADNDDRNTWVCKYSSTQLITDPKHPAKAHGLKLNREEERGLFAEQVSHYWYPSHSFVAICM
jgi:hypothetical protein